MESAETGLDSSSVIQRALKLAQWASLKPFGNFVNTVGIRSYGLAGSGGGCENRAILEEIIATQNQNVHEKGMEIKMNIKLLIKNV